MAGGRPRYWALLAAAVVVGTALLLPPARADTGGPDAYGYVWVDSKSPSPTVRYSWIDIISQGVRLTLRDDDCTFEVSLGFQFRYYGTIVNYLYICSDGFVTFAVPDSFKADPPIPSPSPPNNRAVALGMDLNPAASGSGGIYVLSQASQTPKRFTITWDGVYKIFTTTRETFQIVLEQNETTKDGRILFQYRSLNAVSSPLVGIENAGGTSGLTYPKPLENNLAVQFLPPTDATLPPDTLRVTGSSLAPASVAQGTVTVPMAAIDLSTTSNDVQVTSLRATLSGLGSGAEDVPTARLWLDNGDGTFSTANDPFLKAANMAGSPATAAFDLTSPISVAVGAPRRIFVTYTIASGAGVGDWIGLRIPSASAVSVAFPDVVASTGLPFDTYLANTRTRIDASQDTLRLSQATSLAPAQVEQWATDVPMLSLRFDADRNSVDMGGLRVSLGGNASAGDVWLVKALRDLDADGNYTPGIDVVLATAATTGIPPAAVLPFALTVSAGISERILIVLDVAPGANLGSVLNVTVNQTDVSLAGGTPDLLDFVNFPAVGGNATVVPGSRPTLVLPWVTVPPQADGIWRSDEYLLGPAHTVALERPAGNGVRAFLTAQNNATVLYVAVDPVYDLVADPPDGITIAFDVDQDGAPTPGTDDRFVANASGGARLVYDGTALDWVLLDVCNPWSGNAAIPSCVAGRGATSFRTLPHRFYEFQIPLAVLGVTTPIPPGTTVRFALAGRPHLGMTDGGDRSTWPLVYGPTAPLAFFGALALSSGPAPNRAPSLDWVGTPGYETDGVDPDAGLSNTTFVYKIDYFDPDNTPPSVAQPVLRIWRDGTELAGSPFPMGAEAPKDANYLDGKTFVYFALGLACDGAYEYQFTTKDALGLANATPVLPGPQVACPNQAPALFGESVSPIVANAGSTFTYRVAYADPEGAPPLLVEVEIRRGETNLGNTTLGLIGWVGAPGDFSAGALYAGSVPLPLPGNNYTFRFRTSDGDLPAETSWFFGPYVLVPPPDVLTVAGLDLAPLVVDEGGRRVPFLQLYFLTSDPEVNVTGVRVDRIGTAGDAEVERILLYHDVDQSGTVNGADVLLGSRPPLLGSATFPISLRVTPSNPRSIIFLLNLTRPGTPDGTVGLEVRNATYVSVGTGDTVQSFPTFSARALVNVAPETRDPAVDGHLDGTPGIRHIIAEPPVLSWRYADANGGDVTQAAFNASVWSPSPLTLLWYRNESASTTSVAYGGAALLDGTPYLLQVIVSDGRLWSPVTSVLFRANSPPPAPTPFSPADLATNVDPNAVLLWQPVTDADGDGITYWYWVSDNVGFTSPIEGSTAGPGVTLTLVEGTTYYWRVAASDGYEVTGNATTWRFTTQSSVPPVRGEIRGRVMNGTVPLAEALAQLLVDGSVVEATITGTDGAFRFTALDLGAYVVRLSAVGFLTKTVAAVPTDAAPIVDLQDIPLTRASTGGGGDPTVPEFPWAVLILAIVLTSLVTSFLNFFLFRRRDRREKEPEEENSAPGDDDTP